MPKSLSGNLRLIFLFGDLVILNVAAMLAWIPFPTYPFLSRELFILLMCLNVVWVVLAILFNPYKFPREIAKTNNHYILEVQVLVDEEFIEVKVDHSPNE